MTEDLELPELGSYAAYEVVKQLIMEKRLQLTEAYNYYIKTKNQYGKVYPLALVNWLTALNNLYLEIRPKLLKDQFKDEYGKLVGTMDKALQKTKLKEDEASQCTLELLNFIESIGVTDILFEKPDKNRAVLRW